MTNEYLKGNNNPNNLIYKDLKGDFDHMLNTMDCRENINPNIMISFANPKNNILSTETN